MAGDIEETDACFMVLGTEVDFFLVSKGLMADFAVTIS